MKKKLLLALLTHLLLLLAASTAPAESYADYTCQECLNPFDSWSPYAIARSNYHAPRYSDCDYVSYDADLRCTPADVVQPPA